MSDSSAVGVSVAPHVLDIPDVSRTPAIATPTAAPPDALRAVTDRARVAAVRAAGLTDGVADPALDRLARLAQHLLGVPVALVSLVDDRAQHFPGLAGLDGWAGAARGTPLAYSFCQHVVADGHPLVVWDARDHPRVRDSAAVSELGVVAYCGAPIRTADGLVLGTVCAVDGAPRAWRDADLAVLTELADAAAAECSLRAANRHLAAREAALAEQARELQALFGAMHDVVLVLDRAGVYRKVIPTAPDLLYRPPEAVLGRRLHDVFPTETADRFRAAIDRALDTGAPEPIAYALELPTSGVTCFEATVSPLDASVGTVLWVARDVTARVAAEDAVRASEERFRGISAASPVGIFHATLDGHLEYANPRLAEIWGLAPDQMLGLAWLERVHPEDIDALLGGWTLANQSGREFALRFRLELPPDGPPDGTSRRDGAQGGRQSRLRWVDGRSAVIRDDAGRPIGSVGTVEDVTARLESEAATARLTAILEAMPDIVAIATPNGQIDYVNAAGRQLLGLGHDAADVPRAGLTVARVQPHFAPGGRDVAAVEAAIRDGQWRGETVLAKCDGREIPVEQVLLAHRAEDGHTVEYLSTVLRDITERKHAEATLRAFALVDELTGLYNRRGFLSLAEREWQLAEAEGHGVVVLYCDLDRFKPINDTYGHAEGDRALVAMADVLRRTVRERDVVGRLGGDEFVVLARSGPGQPIGDTAARLRARLAATLDGANATARAAGRPYTLGASVGVATADPQDPARAATLAALIASADEMLYEAKLARAGRR